MDALERVGDRRQDQRQHDGARGRNQEVACHVADRGDGAHGEDDEWPPDRRVAPHMDDRNGRVGLIHHRLLVI